MNAHGLGVDEIHVWRGERHLLRGVSFGLRAGEILQVTGPNGCGKTTLLRVACGLTRPEQGEVRWHGEPITRNGAAYHASLAYSAHEPALKGDLTALENLRFAVGLRRRVSPEALLHSLERVGASSLASLPARVLSAGQRRRVALARILALAAPLWILDEPFTNLDATGVRMLSALLEEHLADGGAALVTAHHDIDAGVDARRLELAA